MTTAGALERPGGLALTTRKKILAVDDSRTMILVEQALLSQAYEVVTASDGVEALEAALESQPDLILMDVIMPRLNGLEAVARLRERPETEHIPVIMVSSRSEMDSISAGHRNSYEDYVTKPIHAAELLEKVRSYLGE